MEASKLSDEEYNRLKKHAWFYHGEQRWTLPVGKVMGELECGDTKAQRVRSIVLFRLGRELPTGPKDTA